MEETQTPVNPEVESVAPVEEAPAEVPAEAPSEEAPAEKPAEEEAPSEG